MLELVQRCLPAAVAVDVRHRQGRAVRLSVTMRDGARSECVLRRAPVREAALCRTARAAGAPAVLGYAPAGPGEIWLLLEALPEQFPQYHLRADVVTVYTHLAEMHRGYAAAGADHSGPWAVTTAELGAHLPTALAQTAARLMASGPVTFVHGDFHRWNILLIDGQVRILDWEHAGWTHPVWDLVLLAPEEPGWDGVPRGAMAELALRTYHEAGPLATLTWPDFLRLQRLARLFVAARWAMVHQANAEAAAPGGARAQIEAYAALEAERAERLRNLLGESAGK